MDDFLEIENNHEYAVQVVGVRSCSREIREPLYYHKRPLPKKESVVNKTVTLFVWSIVRKVVQNSLGCLGHGNGI